MTEQLNIAELRERIDAAITTVCNGMAAMSIPANPRDVDLVLADCAKALAALEEARAGRDALKAKLAALVADLDDLCDKLLFGSADDETIEMVAAVYNAAKVQA